MDCAQLRAGLESWFLAEGSLDEGVAAHLDDCLGCRAIAREARQRCDVVIPAYLLAHVQRQLDDGLLAEVDKHLSRCPFCREEREDWQAFNHEMNKHLGQYALSRGFTAQVLRDWRGASLGKKFHADREHSPAPGLTGLMERAAKGNRYAYERLVNFLKNHAYVRGFLLTGDFQTAGEVALAIFIKGMPGNCPEAGLAGMLKWLDAECLRLSREMHGADGGDAAARLAGGGLSGYAVSRKLRRHRLILSSILELPEREARAILFFHTQRLDYHDSAELMDCAPGEILTLHASASAKIKHKLEAQLTPQ